MSLRTSERQVHKNIYLVYIVMRTVIVKGLRDSQQCEVSSERVMREGEGLSFLFSKRTCYNFVD